MDTLRNRAGVILGLRHVEKSAPIKRLVDGSRFVKLSAGNNEHDLKILANPQSYLLLTKEFAPVILGEV